MITNPAGRAPFALALALTLACCLRSPIPMEGVRTRLQIGDTLATLPRCRADPESGLRLHITVWPDRRLPVREAIFTALRGRPGAGMGHSDMERGGQRIGEVLFPLDQPCRKAEERSTILPISGAVQPGDLVTVCLCILDERGRACPDRLHDLTCAECTWGP